MASSSKTILKGHVCIQRGGGGVVPTTSVYVASRIPGTSFTISSIGGGNSGVIVYYQIYEPAP